MDDWVLIYDGECEFCRRMIRLVERWDTGDRIRTIPFQSADLSGHEIPRAAAEEAMHLVDPDGRVWRGAIAARELLRALPGGGPIRWLFFVPGVLPVAERVYSWIARRRHRFGCSSGVCQRGPG